MIQSWLQENSTDGWNASFTGPSYMTSSSTWYLSSSPLCPNTTGIINLHEAGESILSQEDRYKDTYP